MTSAVKTSSTSFASTALIPHPQDEKAAQATNRQLLLLGRCVMPSPTMQPSPFSALERIQMSLRLNFGIDGAMPRSLVHFDPMFTVLNRAASSALDEDPDQMVVLTNRIQQLIQAKLQDAGCSTLGELQEKSAHIQARRQEAEVIFFHQKERIELCVATDEAMCRACTGELLAHNKSTIANYWILISGVPDGHLLHAANEERFGTIFTRVIFDHMAASMGSMGQFIAERARTLTHIQAQAAFAEYSVKELYRRVHQKQEELLKERAELNQTQAEILLDYLLLQGTLKGPALIKRAIQQHMEPLAHEAEEHVVHMCENYFKGQLAKDLVHYEEQMKNEWSIKRAQEYGEKANTAATESMKEFYEERAAKMNEHAQSMRELYEQTIKELLEQQKDPYKYSISILGDPAEIRKQIPKITTYEKAVLEMMHVDTAQTRRQPEMGMDSGALSKEYFLDKMTLMQHRAFERFTQLSTQIVQVIPLLTSSK